MPSQLPSFKNAKNFQQCLLTGNYLMLLSLLIITGCILMTFTFADLFSINAQIAGHIATIVFAGFFKIGYVLRCIGLHGFGVKDF